MQSSRKASKPNRRKSKRIRGIKFAALAILLTSGGAAAGMFMDGVSESILTFREKHHSPLPSPIPQRSQSQLPKVETSGAVQQPSTPQPSWFPTNNYVEWHLAIRPSQRTYPITIQNSASHQNGIVRIYRETRNSRSKPQPAAILHVKAGHDALLRLPPGTYRAARTSSPTTLSYDEALAREPDAMHSLVIPNRPVANLRLAVDGSTNTQVVQRAQRTHLAGQANRRIEVDPLAPIRSPAVASGHSHGEEYAELMETALSGS